MLSSSALHRLDAHLLPAVEAGEDLPGYAARVLAGRRAEPGDVVVSVVDGDLAGVEAVLVGEDAVLHRGPEISDVYRSGFAAGLLAAIGAPDPHEMQLRRYLAEGQRVLQVAVYPRPPADRGVRLWCTPALIWLFVAGPQPDRLLGALEALRPSWERVRVHHGPPLEAPTAPDLAARYPVEDPIGPLGRHDMAALHEALETVVGQTCVEALMAGRTTPRQAVDTTLRGRRALALHLDRLDKVLEHSHGRGEVKVDLFREAVAAALPETEHSAREHLVAPHRHLVDGMRETQRQVRAAVDGASTTTGLMSSAAVGRLLDRSRANRQASTAVAVGALLIAVLSVFTSLAAIPDRGRAVGDLVRLGSWVGVGGILLLAVAYLLAHLSAVPADRAPAFLREHAHPVLGAAGALALVVFGLAAATASLTLLAVGVTTVFLAAVVRAWTDDF